MSLSKVFSRYLHLPGSHQSTRFLESVTDSLTHSLTLSLLERLVTLKTLRPQISSQTPSPIFWKKELLVISAEAPGFPHHQSREKGGDRSLSTPFPDPTNGHREEPSGQMVIFYSWLSRAFICFYSPGVDQEHLDEHSPLSRKVQKGLYLKTLS